MSSGHLLPRKRVKTSQLKTDGDGEKKGGKAEPSRGIEKGRLAFKWK
jgi:hypothetical protein